VCVPFADDGSARSTRLEAEPATVVHFVLARTHFHDAFMHSVALVSRLMSLGQTSLGLTASITAATAL
jgi:hypothetical protein